MKNAILFASLLGLPIVAVSDPLIDAKAPNFSIEDQFDRPVGIRQFEGRTVVLMAADKEGSAHNDAWKDALVRRFRSAIALVGVADLRGTPFFLKNRVKSTFRKEQGSVLLDWEGVVFTRYGLRPRVSNLIVIDRKGYVRYLHSGPAQPEAIDQVFREIDAAGRR